MLVLRCGVPALDRFVALKFLKSQGWSEEMKNISVMYQTRYPNDVKITYVPYYLIFDHTGKEIT